MRVSKKVRNRLMKDLAFRQGLALVSGVSERTIYNRAKANSELLTTVDSVEYLKKNTELSEAEILVNEKKVA